MWLLILIFIAVAYWYFTHTSNNEAEITSVAKKRSIPGHAYIWPDMGYFGFDIVGESNYQANLAALAGKHGPKGPEVIFTAFLIPEDDNRYDDKAVRIDAEGMTLGYLDRDTARSFRRRLSAKKLTGQTTACKATLKGGHIMRDGNKASYGVSLDLKEFS